MTRPATPGRLGVIRPPERAHPSDYPVRDLVDELIRQGAAERHAPAGELFGRALAKGRLAPVRPRRGGEPVVVPLMGARFDLLYRAALRGPVVPYCWDVWEPNWPLWERRLRAVRPQAVFVTAEQSARHLAERLGGIPVRHLPEAARLDGYHAGPPLAERSIGLLELGRRYERWHTAVRDAAAKSGRAHRYQAAPGQLVFPDEAALRAGLADAMLLACFPSSLTHPERSGGVETMTLRYLEGMASGCLLIGHAPAELVRLLGFNPVVEVDQHAPGQQVGEILADPARWQPQADRARERVREVGDWRVRVRELRAALAR